MGSIVKDRQSQEATVTCLPIWLVKANKVTNWGLIQPNLSQGAPTKGYVVGQ